MNIQNRNGFARWVLFSNGVVDLLAAGALFFPLVGLRLPGYADYSNVLAFIAGGWGIAALTFGIGRIWAAFIPAVQRMMVTLGLIEGVILALFCLANVIFFGITLVQAILPLLVGSIFGALYLAAWLSMRR